MGNISDMSIQVAVAVEEQSAVAYEINRNIKQVVHSVMLKGSFINIWDIEVVRLISIKIDILSDRVWAITY